MYASPTLKEKNVSTVFSPNSCCWMHNFIAGMLIDKIILVQQKWNYEKKGKMVKYIFNNFSRKHI